MCKVSSVANGTATAKQVKKVLILTHLCLMLILLHCRCSYKSVFCVLSRKQGIIICAAILVGYVRLSHLSNMTSTRTVMAFIVRMGLAADLAVDCHRVCLPIGVLYLPAWVPLPH